MDTLSHGLWGGLFFGRQTKKSFWTAFAFGVIPDLASFGPLFISMIFGFTARPDFHASEPPDPSSIPTYIHMLYNITHSFVIFAILFGLIWIVFKKPILEMLAWPLHIALDIFTHSTEFFPTPFLWPLSSLRIDGIPWSTPWIFFGNLAALGIGYGVWTFIVYKKKQRLQIDKK